MSVSQIFLKNVWYGTFIISTDLAQEHVQAHDFFFRISSGTSVKFVKTFHSFVEIATAVEF